MKSLIIRTVLKQEELLTDYEVARKNSVEGEKSLSVRVTETKQNEHSYPLIQNENIFIYDDEEYIIKTSSERTRGLTVSIECTAVHRMFDDLNNNYIYETHEGSLPIENLFNIAIAGSGYTVILNKLELPQTVKVENFGDNNSMALLSDARELVGAEFDVKGKSIYVAKELARYTDEQLRYRYNINQPSKEIDTNSFKTYIRGYGKKKEEKDVLSGQSIPYDIRTGEYYIDSTLNKRATKKPGATFSFSFSGTGFSFNTIVHKLGGKWEFKVDESKTKTIATYEEINPTTKTIEVFRGLENKSHSVVATFKKDTKNPNTIAPVDPVNYLLDGNIINIYRPLDGEESYTVVADYTSPLAAVFGIKHAQPLRDGQYTDKHNLENALKRTLNDSIQITIKLTYVQLLEMGISDIRKGDYVWCIIDPFNIDVRIRVVEVEDYSQENKSPVFILGTLKKKATSIMADLSKTKKTFDSFVEPITKKIKTSALAPNVVSAVNAVQDGQVQIGPETIFAEGYDPLVLLDEIEELKRRLDELEGGG